MAALKVGDKAPYFESTDQDGNRVTSEDFKAKKLISFFYPKANTPGCTAEACNLRDNFDVLIKKAYQPVGVSADTGRRQKNFSNKYQFPFPLLADTDKTVIQSFGVWGTKKFMVRIFDGILRTTFVIDEKGIIVKIIDKVNTKDHVSQILE